MSTAPKIVVCPGCGGDSVFAPSNPYRPFCSERCKLIDLGGWFEERVRIPGQPAPDAENEPLSTPTNPDHGTLQ
jgi:endogenous inhibitor of DNA gyrase (YacG/DUF329 family)